MSKVMVIYKHCAACPYSTSGLFCTNLDTFMKRCPSEGIADWCPLPDLPDYKPEPDRAGWTNGEPITEELTDWLMDFGFNCCLEAITGGTYDKTEDD